MESKETPKDKHITAEEARRCIDKLQMSDRHIGEQHYQMLLDRLQQWQCCSHLVMYRQ